MANPNAQSQPDAPRTRTHADAQPVPTASELQTAPSATDVNLPDRAEAIVRSMATYRRLQAALDTAMPDCLIEIDGRPYRKKGYWQAVALALGIQVELEAEEWLEVNGQSTIQVIYRAALGGRSSTGDGACTIGERKGLNTVHGVRSRAHTRAKSRAIASLVAFGDVGYGEPEDPTFQGNGRR